MKIIIDALHDVATIKDGEDMTSVYQVKDSMTFRWAFQRHIHTGG